MPDETMIFGVSEEGPNGDALGFIDLGSKLNQPIENLLAH